MLYLDTNIYGFDLDEALGDVSEQRRRKALAFKHELGRRQSVLAYRLLKQALAKEYDLIGNPVFDYGEHGKPYLIGHPEIFFNMSHCAAAVACAVSDRPVGVDVESIRPLRPTLAKYVLNDDELSLVMSSDRPDREFTRLWTMKESLLKLRGTGLRDDLQSLLPCDDVSFTTKEADGFVVTVCSYKTGTMLCE